MLLATPVLALMLYVDLKSLAPLMLALAIGTMALTLLGVLAAALGEGARNGGSLMALLVLPLAVPVLIFGTLASTPDDGGLLSPHMLLLMAVLAVLLAIVPVAAAAALVEAETDSS
jgi:heme exporter protein B